MSSIRITLLLYLNDLESGDTGGCTVFPKLDISVRPERGIALLFINLDPATLQRDERMLHREGPLLGNKYVLQWFGLCHTSAISLLSSSSSSSSSSTAAASSVMRSLRAATLA